jgi:hypothetical protein
VSRAPICEFAAFHQQILFVWRGGWVHARPVTTCPECQGAGFVVGHESSSRVRCLTCDGSGVKAARETPGLVPAARDSRSTPAVALEDDAHIAR